MTRQYIAFGLSLMIHLLAFVLLKDATVPDARNTAEAASRLTLPELASVPPELRRQEMVFQLVAPPAKPNFAVTTPNTNLISTVNSAAGDHWTGDVPENDTPHLEGQSKSYSTVLVPPPPVPGPAGLPKGVPAPTGLPQQKSARPRDTNSSLGKDEAKQGEPKTEKVQLDKSQKPPRANQKAFEGKKPAASKNKEPEKEVPKGITLAQLDSSAAKASPPLSSKERINTDDGKPAESNPLSRDAASGLPLPPGVPNPGANGSDDSLAPATLHQSFGGNAPERENVSFGTRQHEWAPYLLKLRDKIGSQWFPLIRMRYTGTWHTAAIVEFSVLPDGTIGDLDVSEGDDNMFKILCLKAVRDAGPFDPFPTDLPSYVKEKKLDIRFTFEFK